ncbi:MAG TPA: YCF48-related protein [Myxococcota bacterium]|nr:YCF48-related protein [Myxococcota bacterium]
MSPKRITIRSAVVLAVVAIATQASAASWIQLSGTPPAAIYHDVYFVDANTGFIVGDDGSGNGVILRTTNGGNAFGDWTTTTVTGLPLWKVFFYDSSHGWAVGDQATIKYTDNGGDSWIDYIVTGLLPTDDLRGVYFADLDNGWLAADHAGTSGNIYFQQGAATSWQMSVSQAVPFHDIGFADFLNGWAVATWSLSRYIFVSTDGGATFNEPGVPPTTNGLYGLAVVTTDDVWVVGDWNIISSSGMFRYNASNWNVVTLPQQTDLRDIDFVGTSSNDGWAVGLSSSILIRSGGAAWATESTTASSDLEGVAAIDTLNAFAVGNNGVILRRGCTGDPECDDGLFCTGTETCVGGVCTSSGDPCLGGPECDNVCDDVADNCNVVAGVACTDDGNVCTDDQCDGTGTCGHPANSASCDDGLFCNGADSCSGGTCSLHVGDPCLAGPECDNVCDDAADNCQVAAGTACGDDGNVCTDDQCDGTGACGHPANSASCDDGLFCNGVDTCSGGVCNHAGDPCLGGPECDNVCDDVADNCNVVAGVACTDDGNVCTDDQCDGTGTCGHPANSASCDDGLFCNGVDTCSGGVCNHAGDPCLGGPECVNVCDDVADNCNVVAGVACTDDGNVCTDDQCDGTGTCGHPANSASCDDGLFCNGVDSCSGGTCSLHVGDPCLAGPECDNVCDDAADNCHVTSGVVCTDDGNVCTDDQCDGTGTCGHPANSAPCDDGLYCNGVDTCSGGACNHAGDPCLGGPECNNVCDDVADNCQVSAGTACGDDGNVCTDDQCDGTGACAHPVNSAPCDDGLFCNGADTCSGGVCNHAGDPCLTGPECDNVCDDAADNCHVTAGTVCTDDGNVCTDDQCDGLGTCAHPVNSDPCDDGLFCTVDDRCSDGLCSGDDNDCSSAAGPCRWGICQEDTDSCSIGNNKDAGTDCEPCGQCDGLGACTGSAARDGDDCDDDDVCTRTGTCLFGGTCQIEGWCDEIVDPDSCDAPAAVYAPDSPDCRFPTDKVDLAVEVGSNIPQQGGFIPVRIRLANLDSLSGGEWSKPLWDLSVVLTLNPVRDSSLSYLLGSALLQSGELSIEEMPDPNAGQVRFLLATDGTPLPVDVESTDSAGWMLDLTLVYGETFGSNAAFDVTVMAPCGADPDVLGCHDPSGWQALSETIRAGASGGDYSREHALELSERPALGCECGSSGGPGHQWLLFFFLLLICPRRRTR